MGEIIVSEQKYKTIVTDYGVEAIANAALKGCSVHISHIAAGDGNGSDFIPKSDMTALKNEVWRGNVISYERDEINRNILKIKGIIPQNVGGFTIREVALFDNNYNMIAIANTPNIEKVALGEGVSSEMELIIKIAVANTDVIVFDVDPTVILATKNDIEKHNQSDIAHEKLIARKIAESTIQRDIVIPVTAWMEEIAEGGGGGVYANVMQKDVTDEMIPIVSIFRECMSIARNCGMSTTAETVNGGVKFYAEKAPEQDISASLLLLRASGGSGTYINNMASDEEVQEMLNEVFGSKTDENVEEQNNEN